MAAEFLASAIAAICGLFAVFMVASSWWPALGTAPSGERHRLDGRRVLALAIRGRRDGRMPCGEIAVTCLRAREWQEDRVISNAIVVGPAGLIAHDRREMQLEP